MARPKKTEEIQSVTEHEQAPATAPVVQELAQPQRRLRIERQGSATVPLAVRLPEVRSGVCEFCGIIDPRFTDFQYKLCGHYRGMELRCSYCPETADTHSVNYKSRLQIWIHPDRPDTLIVVCNSYDCSKAHRERFMISK